MHIAFDFHGVLEKYPEKFKPMMIALKKAGHTVSIMSGPPRKRMQEELGGMGYVRGLHYNHLISIVDYLKDFVKVEMWQDPRGNWNTVVESSWWSAKAKLCNEFGVDVLYDDSIKYHGYFTDSKTLFLLVT